ncbi:hypothetical protein ACWDAZ_33795, partial [Streptomyces sp. NPDC001215]
ARLAASPALCASLGGCHWIVLSEEVAQQLRACPARPGVRARLVYLGCAVALHAAIAQLMYGGIWVDIHAPIPEVQGGAEIMYYGGDIAELLLAAALVTTWRPERRSQPAAQDHPSYRPART